MGETATRAALWCLVVLLLAGGLAGISGARASSTPTYTLFGWVEQPGTSAPVPAGVTVDLTSQATNATYTTQTLLAGGVASGEFKFSAANTANALAPGWWGLSVPAQAKLHLVGCDPCAILPESPTPVFAYFNATDLTTVNFAPVLPNVTAIPYTTTIFGNATNGASPAVNASVQLLAPQFSSLVLANATTNRTGSFNFTAPDGNWVLRTTLPSSPNKFDYQGVTVAGTRMTVNPAIAPYLTYGHVNQASAPSIHVPNGGNATVIDTANMNVYTYPVPPGGFYAIGGYPANFTGPASSTFDVVLSLVGYGTVWYPLTVTTSSTATQHDVTASAISAPATYNTTLNLTTGFSNLTVSTATWLGPNAVLGALPNASIGDLWGQLALDLSHNLSFSSAMLPSVYNWIQTQGPFFPADQASASINGVSFGTNTSFEFNATSTCAGGCDLTSAASISLGYSARYNTSSTVGANLKNYTLAFAFKHPTNAQAFNYTVDLPAGYVLAAGTPAPSGSTLVPAGPGGTWTSFTLVAKPYTTAATTASLPIVKYGNVSAIVNISASNFAFSTKNVLNSSNGNYTVVVASGENVSFSAVNSTFPAGTNGTQYAWSFGDSGTASSAEPTTYHTYANAANFSGSLTVTSSGGQTSTTTFYVLAGGQAPKAVISVNATTVNTTGGVLYALVNWSATLHFNASASSSTLFASSTVPGVLSVANWSLAAHSFSTIANYTAGSGVNAAQTNFTYTFGGAGYYVTSTVVGGDTVTFTGWRYNVTLELWDGGGRLSTAAMVVLVRDTQKPTPAVTLLDSKGRSIASSGIVEGANHTAEVQLSAVNSTDPNNGSLVQYNWTITNSGNSSFGLWKNQSAVSPGFKMPTKPAFWLDPQAKAYTVNLTVTDRAGNSQYRTATVSIAINASQRPVLALSNLTAPSTMTDGTSYTVWVNVTNTLGQNSTALGVTVRFYLLAPSGSGGQINIGGSPSSVAFYHYATNTTTDAVAFANGTANIPFNETDRAVISFNPARQGSWDLWANATATNEFAANYQTGANQAHQAVTLNPNPIVLYEEIGAVVGAVVIVALAVFVWWRRRRAGPSTPSGKGSSSSSTSKSGLERAKKDDKDDDE